MNEIILFSIPLFFALIVLELIWDVVQEKKSGKRYYRLNDSLANLGCGAVDQVTGLFATLLIVGVYAAFFEVTSSLRSWTIADNWAMYLVCFVAVDFLYYWSHRWSHKVNLFWTGHVVHHQSEEYNLSVALRQGAFQKAWMFWVYLPLAFLGFPVEWFVLAKALNLIYQFWIHTELIKRMGWLEYVLNTPSHHRVHHGRNPKYIDKNHAGVFIVWDRLFGTFQIEEEAPVYGITRPLKTFDPVLAHTTPFKQLAVDVSLMPTFLDKVLFLFKSPGWQPKSLGGFQSAPPIEASPKKHDVAIPAKQSIYFLLHQLLLLGALTFFLQLAPELALWEKVAGACFGFVQLSLIGKGVEKSGVGLLEHTRLLTYLVLAGYLLPLNPVVTILALTVTVGSWIFLKYNNLLAPSPRALSS